MTFSGVRWDRFAACLMYASQPLSAFVTGRSAAPSGKRPIHDILDQTGCDACDVVSIVGERAIAGLAASTSSNS